VSYEVKERAKEMKKLHQQIRAKIEKTNEIYKVRANKHCKALTFKPRDFVWLHLRKEGFPLRRRNKLMPRGDGAFRVREKVNDNAYKLELSSDMGVFPTFNVGNLTPNLEEDHGGDGDDLRDNNDQEGEDEANAMPISVQENTRVLLSTQKLHHKGLGPCTDLELQFKVHSKPLGR